ncbi:unnamed protein product [Owenia fusiformis]|uniref:Ammonium transporter n=1 Tax=Owenia fusiformis TaxID=6347 RepID=A0A8J1UBQ1_OWEFU|nr:unnamed protein product [Owenia fusiformis]
MENLTNINDPQRLYDELKTDFDSVKKNLDIFFLVVVACIIYFMQCGFALLECGAVRSKNTTNILIKNLLDSCIGGLSYWIFGYAFAFGPEGNAFISWKHFASEGMDPDGYAHWFFHFVFAATAATIVSGAVAERCDFIAYFAYSIAITGFVYPVASHWAWDEKGWLYQGVTFNETMGNETVEVNVGFQDFAGSTVVHLLGGASSLVAAFILGPRIGRFEDGYPVEIKGHSVPLTAIGGFILTFGFFAFNGGSQGAISNAGDGGAVCLSMVNTVISGSFGAITALILKKMGIFGRDRKWSILVTINGALTGMVSICAGCNVVYPWGAAVTGAIGGLTFLLWSHLILKCKIDDPLDAVAVHMGGGIWGTIAVPIFMAPEKDGSNPGILFDISSRAPWMRFGWNVAGMVSIFVWAFGISAIMWLILRLLKLHRVSEEIETKGLDIPKHGEPAYPAEAYGHGWETKGSALKELAGKSMSETMFGDKTASVRKRVSQRMESDKMMENPEAHAIFKSDQERSDRNSSGPSDGHVNAALDTSQL